MLHQRVEGFLREENERNAKNVTDTLRTGCPFFCYGDEENAHRACTNEHLTTANQSEIRRAYLASVHRCREEGLPGQAFWMCFGKQEADHDGG